MLRKENLVLTYASGKDINDDDYWVYFNSLRKIPNGDHVVLTHDMPDKMRETLADMGDIEVVDVDPKSMQNLMRDRHLAFWDYLNDHGHKYQYVLVTDCRDVVFQANPFDWIGEWKTRHDQIKGYKGFLDHFVVLVSEGFKMPQSGFACIEHFEFERDIPLHHLKENRNRWVVNGGTMMGTPRAMQDWHFLVWSVSTKCIGRCTDQATVNWLLHYLEHDDTYQVCFPMHDHLCLTGEGVKVGGFTPIEKDGLMYSPQNKLYYIVHQWDRIADLKEKILARQRLLD